MYYLSNNILWLISVLNISKAVDPKLEGRVKDRKNLFSLLRILLYFIVLVYSMILSINKHKKLEEEINRDISEDTDSYKR
jgi:hypothetical protein